MTNSASGVLSARRIVIAIDGPSASGKGVIAQRLAEQLGFTHLDTGKLYRIFAAQFAAKYIGDITKEEKVCISVEDERRILGLLADKNAAFGSEEIGKAASKIAKNAVVRHALVELQRQLIIKSTKGIVVDGRDIASVVYPRADIKIFVTARASVRALRRYKQLLARGNRCRRMYKTVLLSVLRRDINDSSRRVAPLTIVKDAFYLNTSDIGIEKTLLLLMKKIKTFL